MKITVDLPLEGLVTQQEAAQLLGVTRQMVRKHEKKGRLHRVVVGGRVMYPRLEVEELKQDYITIAGIKLPLYHSKNLEPYPNYGRSEELATDNFSSKVDKAKELELFYGRPFTESMSEDNIPPIKDIK